MSKLSNPTIYYELEQIQMLLKHHTMKYVKHIVISKNEIKIIRGDIPAH